MTDDDLDAMMGILGRAEPAPAIDAAAILARAATLLPPAPPARGLAGARLGAVLAGTSLMSALLGVLGAVFLLGPALAHVIRIRVPVPIPVALPAPDGRVPDVPPLAVLKRVPESHVPGSQGVVRWPNRGSEPFAAGGCPTLSPAEPDGLADHDLGFWPELGSAPASATPPDEDAVIALPSLALDRRADAVHLVGGFEGLHPQVAVGFVHRGPGRSSWFADGELRVVPIAPTDPTMMDIGGVIRTVRVRAAVGAGLTGGGDKLRFEPGWTLALGVTTSSGGGARLAVANGPQLGVTLGSVDRLHGRLSASVLLPLAAQGDPAIAGTGGIELPLGRRRQ